MTYKTHLLGAAVCCVSINTMTSLTPHEALVFYSSGMLGALLPDIDHPCSLLGQFNPFKMHHRGGTHSLVLVWAILAWSLMLFHNPYLTVGLTIGYLSHLLLDMCNPSGVPLFYPYQKRYSIMRIKTSSQLENGFSAVLLGLLVWMIFK